MKKSRVLLCVMLGTGSCHAAITTLTSTQSPASAAPSNTDLLQTHLSGAPVATYAQTITGEFAGGYAPVLNDGFVDLNPVDYNTNSVLAGTNDQPGYVLQTVLSSVTYTLDTSINTFGYDITSVATYGGWADNGRDQQLYSVQYSLVGAPTTFVTLFSVDFQPGAGTNPKSTTAITSDSGLPMIVGVASLKFLFNARPENGSTGYSEIDVFGVASIPETSTALFSFCGLGVILGGRRRR